MAALVPETHRDLLTAEFAELATVGQHGFPQVTRIWFLLDDDGLVKTSLRTIRQKVKNLSQHPECALFIPDPATPWRSLEMRARAEIIPDHAYAFAEKLGRKYSADLRARDGEGAQRVVVILHAVKFRPLDLTGR